MLGSPISRHGSARSRGLPSRSRCARSVKRFLEDQRPATDDNHRYNADREPVHPIPSTLLITAPKLRGETSNTQQSTA
jgi:hypothetical protein